MKIGVDARILSEDLTGIGRYTLSLLREMIPTGHEWVLYSHRPLIFDFSTFSNVIIKNHSFGNRISRMIWAQTVLPLWAKRDQVDLFWSPGHRLPLFLNGKAGRVVTIHDLVWRHAPDTMRKFSRFLDATLMPISIMMADGVIAVSKQTAKNIVEEIPEVEKEKIKVIYEGVSLSNPLPSSFLSDCGIESPYLLFVGTMEPRKNLHRLLYAYNEIGTDLKQRFKLVIAGGKGWGKEDVLAIIKGLSLQDRVEVLGYVSEEMLATLYKHASLLVMPSIFEGFGLPLVEAMSLGTPVLTSNVSSMQEISGDAAVLVDPLDVSSISFGLKSVLSDDSLRSDLALKGLERVKLFSWETAAKETLSLFEKITEQKNGQLGVNKQLILS